MSDLYAYSFDVGDDALDNEHLILIAPHWQTDPEGLMRAVVACPHLQDYGRVGIVEPTDRDSFYWSACVKVQAGAWANSYGSTSDD